MSRSDSSFNPLTIVGLALSGVGMVGICLCVVLLGVRSAAHKDDEGSSSSVELTRPYDPELFGDDVDAGDPSSDDGELHDARSTDVSYSFEEGSWTKAGTEHLKAYDRKARCSFNVRYPQLKGDLVDLDAINELLKSTALSSVHTYYDDPSSEVIDTINSVVGSNEMMELSSEVTYAVTYNTEDFLSVCYSDVYASGSQMLEFIQLRTVNINLKTGEAYQIDDVLTVDESIATSFVDNLVQTSGDDVDGNGTLTDDECLTVKIGGREALVAALQGKGDLANRVNTCFFVDGNGKVNLGANYWVSSDDGFVRGWWDVTLTDEQLVAARHESDLWELLGL